jgi:hypothetical protein
VQTDNYGSAHDRSEHKRMQLVKRGKPLNSSDSVVENLLGDGKYHADVVRKITIDAEGWKQISYAVSRVEGRGVQLYNLNPNPDLTP